jgi:predicted ferric reductase
VSETAERPQRPQSWPKQRGMAPWAVLVFYLVLALAPVGLAAIQDLEPRPFADEFSSAISLVALSMMLLEFVLSGRYAGISGKIGIDLTMRFHQLVARAVVAAILIHPFIYTTPFQRQMPWDTGEQMALGLESWSILTGAAAWALIFAFVMLSWGRRRLPYVYETWRLWHGVGAVLIVALVAHHAFAAGRYSQQPALIAFWAALMTLAALTLIYVHGLRNAAQARHPYLVHAVTPIAEGTWELRLRADGDASPEPFLPGQFAWVKIGRSPFRITEHPFSMSSSPDELPEIAFTIREAGDFTNRIGKIQPGTRAYLDGPHGSFVPPEDDGQPLIYLAGGAGIAPIISHLRALRDVGDTRELRLVYGARTHAHLVALDELKAMQRQMNFTLEIVLQRPPADWDGHTGFMTREVLDAALPGGDRRNQATYMMCGPGPMIDAVDGNLRALGVPQHKIIAEKFDYD